MFVIVRDVVRHANLNETINYKISLHLSIQGCLALACLGDFHRLFLYPASQYCLALYHRNDRIFGSFCFDMPTPFLRSTHRSHWLSTLTWRFIREYLAGL